MGFVRGFSQILVGAGMTAFAVISCSAPLIPRISFITGQFANDIILYVGAWGGCVVVGQSETCPKPQFGYSISLENFPNKTNNGPDPLNATLTYAMVLYPLAGFLAFLSLLSSMPRRSRFTHYLTVVLIVLSFMSGAIALVVSLLLYIRGMQRINAQFAPQSPAMLGSALWLAIGGVVAEAFGFMLFAGSGSPNKRSFNDAASDQQSLYGKEYSQVGHKSISNPVFIEPAEIGVNQGSYVQPGSYYQPAGPLSPGYEPSMMSNRKNSRSGGHR